MEATRSLIPTLRLLLPRPLQTQTSKRLLSQYRSPFPPFRLQHPPKPSPTTFSRHNTSSTSPDLSNASASVLDKPIRDEKLAYELVFTCKPCQHRSSHRISRQGYHQGSVLITCPECKNRHVISDHLKVIIPAFQLKRFFCAPSIIPS